MSHLFDEYEVTFEKTVVKIPKHIKGVEAIGKSIADSLRFRTEPIKTKSVKPLIIKKGK